MVATTYSNKKISLVVAYLKEKTKEMTTCLNQKVMGQKYLVIAIYLLQMMMIISDLSRMTTT